mmetsp:Transcript_25984/g.36836  ORF Transcript_25984/g.36836 Transcript_25984/m.36836 type:complete len:111 (+) Transcript_25984:166-498(+)
MKEEVQKTFCLYLLRHSQTSKTYVGVTNNLQRRLRQHNGEISGGAKYTRAFRGTGHWKIVMAVSALSRSQALSAEIHVKRHRYRQSETDRISQKRALMLQLAHKFQAPVV